MFIWLNEELRDESEAALPATAAGTLLGLGVFTTIGVWAGQPFALERHLERLRRNALALDLEVPFADGQLREALDEALCANAIRDGMARITVTARGDGRWNFGRGSDVSIAAQPHRVGFDPQTPLRLGVSPFRAAPDGALDGIKSTSYAGHWRAWREAQQRGLDEALLLTSNGEVCEAARANVFWVRDGAVWTPGLECAPLPGIARGLIVEWCRDTGVTCHEGAYRLDEVCAADEAFLTASTTGPRPVGSLMVDGGAYRFTAPGEVTQRMVERWMDEVGR